MLVRRFEFPEGATPIADCSGLIPNWVHHLDDLNRVEAENGDALTLYGRFGLIKLAKRRELQFLKLSLRHPNFP